MYNTETFTFNFPLNRFIMKKLKEVLCVSNYIWKKVVAHIISFSPVSMKVRHNNNVFGSNFTEMSLFSYKNSV